MPTLLSARKRDSAGLQPTPTMSLSPRPPMVRMSRILAFDWDSLHSFAGSDAQDDHMQKWFPQLTFAIGVKTGSFVMRDWNSGTETTQHNLRCPMSPTATCSDLVLSISRCICKDRLSSFRAFTPFSGSLLIVLLQIKQQFANRLLLNCQ